jgi:hypothetical protein
VRLTSIKLQQNVEVILRTKLKEFGGKLGHHAQATDSEGRLDWPTGCLQPNCKCSAYTRPARPYLEYETTWLEPMLVAAPKEENGVSKTAMA